MYLGLGYIFWSKLTAWKIDKQSNLCYIMTQFKKVIVEIETCDSSLFAKFMINAHSFFVNKKL